MTKNTATSLLTELVNEYNMRVAQDMKLAEKLVALGVTSEDFRVISKNSPLPTAFVLDVDLAFNRIGRGLHDLTQQQVKNERVSKYTLNKYIKRLEDLQSSDVTENTYPENKPGR